MKHISTDRILMLGMAMTADKPTMEKRIRGIFSKNRTSALVRVLIIVFCLAMGFMCFTTACQTGYINNPVVKDDGLAAGSDAEGDDAGAGKKLTLYVDEMIKRNNPTIAQRIIRSVKDANPDVDVSWYDPSYGDTTMTMNDKMTRMNSDLLVGKGPDVIIGSTSMFSCSIATANGEGETISVETIDVADLGKQILSGAYVDLTSLIENDPDLSYDDCFEKVLDGARIGGKLCAMPLTFNYSGGMTCGDTLSAAGISISASDSIDKLIDELDAYLRSGGERQVFEGSGGAVTSYLLYAVAQQMFDYETGSVDIDYELIKRILDLDILDGEGEKYSFFSDDDGGAARQAAGNFVLDGDNQVVSSSLSYASALERFGGALHIPFRNKDGGVTAEISYYGMISTGTSDVKLAYSCLKAAMDAFLSDVQCTNYGIPIIKKYAEEYFKADNKDLIKTNLYQSADLGEPVVMPQSFLDEYLALADEVTSVTVSTTPAGIIMEAFMPYLGGEKTFEECKGEAEYNLMLFLSE